MIPAPGASLAVEKCDFPIFPNGLKTTIQFKKSLSVINVLNIWNSEFGYEQTVITNEIV